MDKQSALRALYIMYSWKKTFEDVLNDGQFIFVDARSSMDFLSFLNTYLVKNAKS